jgi:PiT family inorganic phosphate transporter
MGLIMLILIGTVPTAYAVNHAVTTQQTADFVAVSTQTADALSHYVSPSAVVGDSRDEVTDYIRSKQFTPNTMLALRELINGIGTEMAQYKQLKAVPQDQVRNFRNDMYVVSEALRLMKKTGEPKFSAADSATIANYKKHIDNATKFIPTWVKVAVALALGLGTMIGWKRIVVTVGEKIGKDHLTYAQGAAAEITAMATIGAGRIRLTCEHDARAVVRRGGNDDGKPFRAAMGNGAESIDGVGADAACIDHAGRILVLAFPQDERRLRNLDHASAPPPDCSVR